MKNRVAYFGVFTSLALILSYVESLIPIPFGVPGMKLGLANLVILIALYQMKVADVYLLAVVRVLLSGFLFGNYFSILYSLAGGLFSLSMMYFFRKREGYTKVGVSMVGGVFHNVGQCLVAGVVVGTFKIVYYLPVLLLTGLVTGFLIGIIGREVLKRLPVLRSF